MAPWQVKFSLRSHAFSLFFVDSTGQVYAYGYQLVTIMLLNPETLRGIPVVHLIAGRLSGSLLSCVSCENNALIETLGNNRQRFGGTQRNYRVCSARTSENSYSVLLFSRPTSGEKMG
jgi:hypothetical protein